MSLRPGELVEVLLGLVEVLLGIVERASQVKLYLEGHYPGLWMCYLVDEEMTEGNQISHQDRAFLNLENEEVHKVVVKCM